MRIRAAEVFAERTLLFVLQPIRESASRCVSRPFDSGANQYAPIIDRPARPFILEFSKVAS